MSRLLRWLPALAGVALLLGGVAWSLRLGYERGKSYPVGSSHRSDAEGVRALYLLLEEMGHAPRRLHRPVPALVAAVLLAVEPSGDREERNRELVKWVEGGGTLVLADSGRAAAEDVRRLGWLDFLNEDDGDGDDNDDESGEGESRGPGDTAADERVADGIEQQADEDADHKNDDSDKSEDASERRRRLFLRQRPRHLARELGLEPASGSVPAGPAVASTGPASLRGFQGHTADHYWKRLPPDAVTLLGEPERPVLALLRKGRGRVFALSEAAWLSNAGLTKSPRLELALELLLGPGRPVYFDEYRHGLAENPGLAYVLGRYGLFPAATALVLFLGLVAWRTTPAEAPLPEETDEGGEVRDSLVDVRAGLYAHTLPARDALRLMERDLRASLSAALGAAQPLPWDELTRRHAERHPAGAERLEELRAALRTAAGSAKSLQALLPLSARLARYLEEIR